MIRPWGRIEPDTCLVALVPCLAAALTADHGSQPFENLVPNAELIENLASDTVRIARQGEEQMLRAHEALSLGLRFGRRLHDHAAGSWGQ
ncbi:MAG: hypothetical protein M3256_01445 [Actinomycetota bacterium]|nr:hypothetical protein [Actinomycetota bacterium]